MAGLAHDCAEALVEVLNVTRRRLDGLASLRLDDWLDERREAEYDVLADVERGLLAIRGSLSGLH